MSICRKYCNNRQNMAVRKKWVYGKKKMDKKMFWQRAEERGVLHASVCNLTSRESTGQPWRALASRPFQIRSCRISFQSFFPPHRNLSGHLPDRIMLLAESWGISPLIWGVMRLYLKGKHVNFFSQKHSKEVEYYISDPMWRNRLIRAVEWESFLVGRSHWKDVTTGWPVS